MTGWNPLKSSKKSAGSASSDIPQIKIRYEYKSVNEEFLMTYYVPVNEKQQPHGIGYLYAVPTLIEAEVFYGNLKNGVVNDANGKAPFLGITLFGLGYTHVSIINGKINDFDNN